MNEKQKRFLNEFHGLLRKYDIDEICISYHSGDKEEHRITLCSNEQKLEFMGYIKNHFIEVSTYDGNYEADDSDV